MTYLFRKAHTRGERERSAKSLTSLTSLIGAAVRKPACELDHDWTATHPRKARSKS